MVIKSLLRHKFLLALAIIATGAITWASLARFVNPIDFHIEGSDKIAHAIAYFVLTITWFLFFFFSERQKLNWVQSISRASMICLIYGALMEILQYLLTSYRSFEWYDMMANASGIIFAVFLLKLTGNKLISFKETM